MRTIVVDRVGRDARAPVVVERLPRVRIDVEAREVAARDVDPDAMPLPEYVGRRIELERERVDLAWLQEPFRSQSLPETPSHDAVCDVHVEPAGKVRRRWMHVQQLRREISVESVGRGPKRHGN